jgi:hypothetical protein
MTANRACCSAAVVISGQSRCAAWRRIRKAVGISRPGKARQRMVCKGGSYCSTKQRPFVIRTTSCWFCLNRKGAGCQLAALPFSSLRLNTDRQATPFPTTPDSRTLAASIAPAPMKKCQRVTSPVMSPMTSPARSPMTSPVRSLFDTLPGQIVLRSFKKPCDGECLRLSIVR